MKTYLLKNGPVVEPKTGRKPRSQDPLAPPLAGVAAQSPQPRAAAPQDPALFIGMDVHNDSIAVSLAPGDSTEVRRYGLIGGSHDDVLKLCKKLQAAHPAPIRSARHDLAPAARVYPCKTRSGSWAGGLWADAEIGRPWERRASRRTLGTVREWEKATRLLHSLGWPSGSKASEDGSKW